MRATIHVTDLRVDCLIGCLARERLHAQTLRVDLSLDLDHNAASLSDRLDDTWDYGTMARDLTFVLQQGRFYLLEAAAQVLLRYLLAPPGPSEGRPRPIAATVKLTKFGVLPGQATPSVELQASAEELDYAQEHNPWGTVDVIAETRLLGLYRLNVLPQMEIPNHEHHVMREAELVLSCGMEGWKEGRPPSVLPMGSILEWQRKQPHGYRNTGTETGSILCLDSPPFDPTDEVEVPL